MKFRHRKKFGKQKVEGDLLNLVSIEQDIFHKKSKSAKKVKQLFDLLQAINLILYMKLNVESVNRISEHYPFLSF